MDHILELAKRKAEQAEVYRMTRRETPVTFEANRLKMLQTRETSGAALRIVKDGRVGFSATNDPNDIEDLVGRALELAPFGPPARFTLPGLTEYPPVRLFDETVEQVSIERMVELGQSMIDAVRRQEPDLQCEGRVSKNVGTVEVMNSNGGYATYQKSGFALGVEGTLIRGTDMLFVGDFQSSSSPITDTKDLIDKVLRQLEMAKRTVPAPTGKLPVLFMPGAVTSALLGPLVTAFNGRTVLQGSSPLVGKLGQKMLDERVSLWDDPTVDLRPGSRNADDEGVPARQLDLVRDGRISNFFYDLQTAGLAGVQSTGSGSRFLGSVPRPNTSLLTLRSGDTSFRDIVSSIKDGLLVEDLLGVGQGNVAGGEFGGNVLLGFRIQDGEIVGRVKDTVISGNVYDALNKIVAISNEPRWVGSTYLPHVCCEGITVSTKAG